MENNDIVPIIKKWKARTGSFTRLDGVGRIAKSFYDLIKREKRKGPNLAKSPLDINSKNKVFNDKVQEFSNDTKMEEFVHGKIKEYGLQSEVEEAEKKGLLAILEEEEKEEVTEKEEEVLSAEKEEKEKEEVTEKEEEVTEIANGEVDNILKTLKEGAEKGEEVIVKEYHLPSLNSNSEEETKIMDSAETKLIVGARQEGENVLRKVEEVTEEEGVSQEEKEEVTEIASEVVDNTLKTLEEGVEKGESSERLEENVRNDFKQLENIKKVDKNLWEKIKDIFEAFWEWIKKEWNKIFGKEKRTITKLDQENGNGLRREKE